MFKGIKFAYLATVLDIGSPIILLPIMLIKLDMSEMGFWYVMGSLNILVKFPENSLNNSIIRNVTYFKSKFELNLSKSDLKKLTSSIKNIIDSKIKLLLLISLIVYLIPCGLYIAYIDDSEINYITWIIFFSSNLINILSNKYKTIIITEGGIENVYKPEFISKIIYITSSIFCLFLELKIIGLVISMFISSLINLKLLKSLYTKYYYINPISIISNSLSKYLKLINLNIKKEFSKQIQLDGANTFISKFSVIIIGAAMSIEAAGIFGLTSNIFNIIHRVSLLPLNYITPYLIKLRGLNKEKILKKIFYKILILSLIFVTISSAFLIFFGQSTLEIISKTAKIENQLTIILFYVLTLMNVYYDFFINTLIIFKDYIFLKSNIITSIIVVLVQMLFTSEYGSIGLILTSIIIPSFYIYWKWPVYMMKKFKKI